MLHPVTMIGQCDEFFQSEKDLHRSLKNDWCLFIALKKDFIKDFITAFLHSIYVVL